MKLFYYISRASVFSDIQQFRHCNKEAELFSLLFLSLSFSHSNSASSVIIAILASSEVYSAISRVIITNVTTPTRWNINKEETNKGRFLDSAELN